ncbi:MFS transporter [Leucobacter komagatae]
MSGAHFVPAAILAGGTVLYAMNLYFTAALMPSIVEDIGGQQLFAWVATGFLIAAVIASTLAARSIAALGARGAYLVGFCGFALGSAAAALSGSMEVFVASRVLQGLGGGLLAGLGYAVIRSALPQKLWLKAAALVSAMWGIGALVGPSLGGMFGELGAWRAAYAVLAGIAILFALLSVRALPGRAAAAPEPVPYASLAALVAAAASLSVAPMFRTAGFDGLAVAVGVLLLVLFLAVESRATHTVLPKLAFARGNELKWVYALVATLCAGVMIETYVPLFGQQLGGLSPVWAGFLGAALSLGWTGMQLVSVKFGPRIASSAMIGAPILLALSMATYGLLQAPEAGGARILAWAVALVLGGVAIGAVFPHLSVRAMGASADAAEGEKAAAALSTTQLIAYALVSALLGVFAAGGDGDAVVTAERISLGLAVITGVGVVPGLMLLRAARRGGRKVSLSN